MGLHFETVLNTKTATYLNVKVLLSFVEHFNEFPSVKKSTIFGLERQDVTYANNGGFNTEHKSSQGCFSKNFWSKFFLRKTIKILTHPESVEEWVLSVENAAERKWKKKNSN